MTSPHAMLGNRYQLLARIATGGMGEVWRARDELLGREVAVKLLRSHVAADPTFRSRFRNEARITAGLADPGIAQVFDYGEQNDLAYLVMELVHGEPLSAILGRNGALGPEVALDVMHQTAKALHAAHSAGVIHRDIKPGNLLVTREGTIKVTDFGIARALEAAPVTQTGTVLGTAQYVSPEQAQGSPLTPATDLYSLGVVAYECLTGHTPFRADTQVAIALQHLNEPPPPLPEHIPASVRGLVMALLSKDAERRPAGALALADRAYVLRESLAAADSGTDLSMLTDPSGFRVREAYRPGEPSGPYGMADRTTDSGVVAPEPTAFQEASAPRRRRRRTTVLVATAGCVAAVGLGTFAVSGLDRPQRPQVAEPTETLTPAPSSHKPTRTKKPPRRPTPSVQTRTARPVPSRSATVSTSATPTKQEPTPEPTPTTPTPSPTPTPTPTTPTPTPTPSTSPDPGDTNPPKEET